MEEDIIKIEKEIKGLEQAKTEKVIQEVSMDIVMSNVEYFLAHLN